MIIVQNLCKTFLDRRRGEVKAVDRVSFTCRPGEIFGLLGPNGAGKTTTLRMLATILRPTSGSATLAGHDVVQEAAAVRQKIGFISGNTAIYDKLTPSEMVAYAGRLYGLDRETIRRRTQEIFAMLGVDDYAHTLNGKLSSGMRQKVSLARTIIHDPAILIFDEPTVSLDVLVAKSVLDFIARCRKEQKCIILSTHIMSEAEKLCDRLAIVHKGAVKAMGTLAELKQQTGQTTLEDVFFSLVPAIG
jgi:sodium transport system ATP-binding protein